MKLISLGEKVPIFFGYQKLHLIVGHVDSVIEIAAPKDVIVVHDRLSAANVRGELNPFHDFVVVFVAL